MIRGSGRWLAARQTLPEPWDVATFCRAVGRERGRPVHLISRPGQGDSITAALLSTDAADYIFWRDDLSGFHRDHAILHEIWHLLAACDDCEATLAPRFRGAVRRTVHSRRWNEVQAEAFADQIMNRACWRTIEPTGATDYGRVVSGFGKALR